MTNSAADTSDGHADRTSNRPMRRGCEGCMSSSTVNENLGESREGSKVRQGIAGCSPVGVKGMRGLHITCLQTDRRNANEGRLSPGGESSSDDLSVLHVDNAIGLSRELVVMRDDHERRTARLAQRAHQSKQPVSAVGV